MLTVDFDRLGVRPGSRLLDMGCGGGRHAFEAMRRGAVVVALDYSEADLKDVRAVIGAMEAANEIPAEGQCDAVNGDALSVPFADCSFDFIIVSEVFEHIWADEAAMAELVRVLKPEGRMAVTVPTRWPERVSWALNYRYHDTPGGHIRIYRQHDLEGKLERAGLLNRGSHHAHALHSPYWWIRCVNGVDNDDAFLTRKYHDLLTWDIVKGPWITRVLERTLRPVLGKSLVLYTERAPEWMVPRPDRPRKAAS